MKGHTGQRGPDSCRLRSQPLFVAYWLTGLVLCILFLTFIIVYFFFSLIADLCGSSPLRQNKVCLAIGGKVQYTPTAQKVSHLSCH